MSHIAGQVGPNTVEFKVSFKNGAKGRKHLREPKQKPKQVSRGRIPRVARLMALAIRIEQMIQDGELRDYAELARVGHITRARASQIMNLLNLAPDIQEELLFLPPVFSGRDPVSERELRPIAAVPDWRKQRRMWVETEATKVNCGNEPIVPAVPDAD